MTIFFSYKRERKREYVCPFCYPPSNQLSVEPVRYLERNIIGWRAPLDRHSRIHIQEVSNATDMRDLNPETRRCDTTAEMEDDYDRESLHY